MDPGGGFGSAFGGGKAGAAQDPLTFLKRPPVVVRLTALVSEQLRHTENTFSPVSSYDTKGKAKQQQRSGLQRKPSWPLAPFAFFYGRKSP